MENKNQGKEPLKPLSPPVHPAQGDRGSDFMVDGWRVFKIMAEFVSGFEVMGDAAPAVSVFGSTRVEEGSAGYELARTLGGMLAREGISVITGGGTGCDGGGEPWCSGGRGRLYRIQYQTAQPTGR